nr:PREDICTED: uncharacterized protein LOC103277710 [Anolis carolinensis]|eukprot:XP_016846596.1 PREDICTED: uncharacterized protein LOC103277710 [Anolis carolinensis]
MQRRAYSIDLLGGRFVQRCPAFRQNNTCIIYASWSAVPPLQRSVDYVARKHLKMATYHFLKSDGRACGEMVSAVLNSLYCCVEAALDLYLVKVKEGPWLAQEGKEQGSLILDAATARAMRAISRIVCHIKDSTRVEGWFPGASARLGDQLHRGHKAWVGGTQKESEQQLQKNWRRSSSC